MGIIKNMNKEIPENLDPEDLERDLNLYMQVYRAEHPSASNKNLESTKNGQRIFFQSKSVEDRKKLIRDEIRSKTNYFFKDWVSDEFTNDNNDHLN